MFHVLNVPKVLFAWIFRLCLHDKNKTIIDLIGLSSVSFILDDRIFQSTHLISLIWIQDIFKIYCFYRILKHYSEEVTFKNSTIDSTLV